MEGYATQTRGGCRVKRNVIAFGCWHEPDRSLLAVFHSELRHPRLAPRDGGSRARARPCFLDKNKAANQDLGGDAEISGC
ncbi:hypothetical protein LIA77_11214 [Sarocladium implicatum]|nr:hypothetical protein LIA77_11214 [Sarocladium implicatum]